MSMQSGVTSTTSVSTTGMYHGFSPATRLWIVIIAAAIAIGCLVFGGYITMTALDKLEMDDDYARISNALIGQNSPQSKVHPQTNINAAVRVSIVQSGIHLKHIINQQSLNILAIFSGFALIAIGFALFLIGADGAFQLQASGVSNTQLVVTGTTPGVLCFVLAGLLIVTAIIQKQELKLPDVSAGKHPVSVAESTTNDSDPDVVPSVSPLQRAIDSLPAGKK